MSDSIDPKNDARQHKLDLCLHEALRLTDEFLSDPKRVAEFNMYVTDIAKEYMKLDKEISHTQRAHYMGLKVYDFDIEHLHTIDLDTKSREDIDLAEILGKTIVVNPMFADYFSSDELTKIALHEIYHVIAYMHGPHEKKQKNNAHAEELSADAFSDFAKASPTMSDIAKKVQAFEALNVIKKNGYEIDNTIKTAIHKKIDSWQAERSEHLQEEKEDHPTPLKRMDYSQELVAALAIDRTNSYLERIYDNYDSDYAAAITKKYSDNTIDLVDGGNRKTIPHLKNEIQSFLQ